MAYPGSVLKKISTVSSGINTGTGIYGSALSAASTVGGAIGALAGATGALGGAASAWKDPDKVAGPAAAAAGLAGEMGWSEPANIFGGTSGGGLMFPTDLGSATSMNYMGFQAYEIVGGIGSAKTDRDYEMKGEPIYLPIPDAGINEPFNQNWGHGDVSMFEAALSGQASKMSGNIQDVLQSGDLASKSGKAITSGITGMADAVVEGAKTIAGTMGESIVTDYNTIAQGVVSGLRTALKLANTKGVAQAAVGVGLQMAGQPLSQAAGLAGFKETAYLYQGPSFRPFSFSFSLKPTSAAESTMIQRIITHFRIHGMPVENAGDLYRIYSLPHAFEIKFYHSSGENKYLPELGKCVLTGFNAKYGGDRFSTFSSSHAPVQVDISMNFVEIELQTRFAQGSSNSAVHL